MGHPYPVITMGLHPTVSEINDILVSVGTEDRLIQLDEFETVRFAHSGRFVHMRAAHLVATYHYMHDAGCSGIFEVFRGEEEKTVAKSRKGARPD